MNSAPASPVTVIRPSQGWLAIDLRELWGYRELLWSFTKRDFQVRYRQTLLGLAWAVIVPVVQSFVFTWLFGGRAGASADTNNLPPMLYYMCNLVAWRYFSAALTAASGSLVSTSGMWTKIYFPRLLLPMSACLTGMIDLAIGLVMIFGLQIWYGIAPPLAIFFLPVFALLMVVAALGIGLLFAALNVRFRDVNQFVPFVVQIWMFVTVIKPYSYFHQKLGGWVWLYALNPMAGVVEGTRWALLGYGPGAGLDTPWRLVAIGLGPALGLLLFGLFYFRRVENQFSDVV